MCTSFGGMCFIKTYNVKQYLESVYSEKNIMLHDKLQVMAQVLK